MARHALTNEELARGRTLGAALGGRAVKNRVVPRVCPCCGREMGKRTWHSYLGHLGANATAKKYYGGDVVGMLRHVLAEYGDAFPENGKWRRWKKGEGVDGGR